MGNYSVMVSNREGSKVDKLYSCDNIRSALNLIDLADRSFLADHFDDGDLIELDFTDWAKKEHPDNESWKLDEEGNCIDQSEFDSLYEEYTYYQQALEELTDYHYSIWIDVVEDEVGNKFKDTQNQIYARSV